MEPQTRIGLAALAKFAFGGGDLKSLYAELISLIKKDPNNAGVLMDLSVTAQMEGHQDLGLAWQAHALETCRVFRPLRKSKGKKTALVYAAPIHMGGNTPVELLLETSDFDVITYYPSFDLPPEAYPVLPHHDVAFCAAPADHERAEHFFETVRRVAALQGTAVVNLPENLVKPDRGAIPELFNYVEGLRTPKTLQLDRASLERMLTSETEADELAETARYPFIVRPVGSHAGHGLQRVESREAFAEYLASRPEDAFFVSEFINYASKHDGLYRKARIVCVNGEAFPCHLAVADRWDIWYANAEMEHCADKRRDEAEFMDNFADDFGKRHQRVFDALTEVMGLDYFGFDCAEDQDGNLVLFEIDNALIVHDLDNPEVFPYKSRHMQSVFEAFENLLISKCRTQDVGPPTKVIAGVQPRAARSMPEPLAV